jgi:hypothetical protein
MVTNNDPPDGSCPAKVAAPKNPQPGRRPDAVPVNLTLDRDAFDILQRYCEHGRRGTGRFMSRLLYGHDARMQERERIGQQARNRGEGDKRTN